MKVAPPQKFNKGEKQDAGVFAVLHPNFSPVDHPIISRHWFNVEPFRPVGKLAAEVVADIEFRRQVERLHAMGPRPMAEMLGELAASRNLGTVIDEMLSRYAEIPDQALNALGGHEFPPLPLHEVGL